MRRGHVSLVFAFVLVVAACGSGGGEGEVDGTVEAQGESLQDFIPGAFAFNPENAEEQFRQQEQQVQQEIATCMAEQGFEYVPYVPNFEDQFFRGAESEEESAELYGLHISYDLLNQHEFEFEEGEVPPEVANDPNYAIREAMSEDEARAYDEALHGDEPDIDFESMTEEEIDAYFQNWQPGGCANDAYEEAFDAGASQAFYEQFSSGIEDMYQRAQADPRIAEIESNWSACMSEAGYEFADEEEASIFILRRLEEVGAISELEIDPRGGWGYSSGEALEPGSAVYKAVEAVFEEEVAIAKASIGCRGDVMEVFQEVFAEYEQEFIDQNREALEKFREENS